MSNLSMRFTASLLLALVFCTPIFANATNWKNAGKTSSGEHFIDTDSISVYDSGARVTLVTKINVFQVHAFTKYRSLAAHMEFDCRSLKVRKLASRTYSDLDLRGKIVDEVEVPGEFVDVPPGSATNLAFDMACGLNTLGK